MLVRRTRLAPGPFPWIQAFPGANWPQHFRTGSSHQHGRPGLERPIASWSGACATRTVGALPIAKSQRASRLGDTSQVEPPHNQLVATSTKRRPWRPAAACGPRSAFGTRIRDAERMHLTTGAATRRRQEYPWSSVSKCPH